MSGGPSIALFADREPNWIVSLPRPTNRPVGVTYEPQGTPVGTGRRKAKRRVRVEPHVKTVAHFWETEVRDSDWAFGEEWQTPHVRPFRMKEDTPERVSLTLDPSKMDLDQSYFVDTEAGFFLVRRNRTGFQISEVRPGIQE